MESMKIPPGFNYDLVKSLSNESREKFKRILPLSMGQAARIPGVRNSDLAVLMVNVARRPGQGAQDREVSESFLAASKLPAAGTIAEAEAFVSQNRIERSEAEGEEA
jgi:tRNA uridine 5-carboxymethylaminomethyl modification enzyme